MEKKKLNNPNIAEDGKATRFGEPNGNDNTKGGQKPSIKRELIELMNTDGRLKIPPESVLSIEDDGSVIIRVPTQKQIAMKLKQLATIGKNMTTLKAIEMISIQLDGKPVQPIEQTDITPRPDYSRLSNRELKQMARLQAKVR